MDSFGRIIAIIVAIILIILFPLQYLAQNQINIIDCHVQYETKKLADEIMLKGYISWDMYQKYLGQLASTNQLYDISFIHSKPKEGFQTSSRIVSSEKVLTNNTNNRRLTQGEYFNDMAKVSGMESTYRAVTLKTNKEHTKKVTNEVKVKKNKDTFINNKSKIKGNTIELAKNKVKEKEIMNVFTKNSQKKLGLQTVAKMENKASWFDLALGASNILPSFGYGIANKQRFSETKEEIRSLAVHSHSYSCYLECMGVDNNGDGIINYNDCDITTTNTPTTDGGITTTNYKCIGCNAIIRKDSKKISYYGPPVSGSETFPHFVTATLVCDKIITSFMPTKPYQVVTKGQSLDTTATVTYLDGHVGTVNCMCNNYDSNKLGVQTVNFGYYGRTDNKNYVGVITTQVNVNVTDTKALTSINVSPSSQSVTRYTNPSFVVNAVYSDYSSKQVTGYTISGFDNKVLGAQTVTITYTEGGVTISKNVMVTVKRLTNICSICGTRYELDDNNIDHGCPICSTTIKNITATPDKITVKKGDSLNIKVMATYRDEHTKEITGWTSNYDNSKLGEQTVTVTYGGFSASINVTVTQSYVCTLCGTVYPANDDGSDPGCPTCKASVISISATPNTQEIQLGGNMQLTVVATYRDGHQEEVTEWTSDFNSFKVGKQTVNISYSSKTTIVTVYVQSDIQVTCSICGTTYNPIEHPYGCPICAETVVGIEARLRNGGTQVQYKSELNLYIILIYKDNHRVITYNDWSVEGYQADKLGNQTITVKYKTFQTTLDIEVVNTLQKKVCPNGHVYYLNEDGSDPGCPYCNVDPTTDSSQGYTECVYTKQILEKIYEDGIYSFEEGDYVTITVKQKNVSFYDKLGHLFPMPVAEVKKYIYGGMISSGQ